MIRVAAVDDHPVMLGGLRAMTGELPGRVEFVAYAPTVAGLVASDVAADVVLLDLHLGDGTRPRDNVQRLLAHGLRVLVYTEGDRRAWVSDAIHAGAQGIVLKAQSPEDLLEAIETVHAGQPVLSPEMADILRRDAALRPQLAPREEEALTLVAHGLADKAGRPGHGDLGGHREGVPRADPRQVLRPRAAGRLPRRPAPTRCRGRVRRSAGA